MTRAAAILIKDHSVALIRRFRAGRLYYIFPGGQVEPGETSMQAAVREIREELGLEIQAGALVAEARRGGTLQLYYLGTILGGEFGSGDGPELRGEYAPECGPYEPVWLPIDRLLVETVYPASVCKLIQDAVKNGWNPTPAYFED